MRVGANLYHSSWLTPGRRSTGRALSASPLCIRYSTTASQSCTSPTSRLCHLRSDRIKAYGQACTSLQPCRMTFPYQLWGEVAKLCTAAAAQPSILSSMSFSPSKKRLQQNKPVVAATNTEKVVAESEVQAGDQDTLPSMQSHCTEPRQPRKLVHADPHQPQAMCVCVCVWHLQNP